MLSVVIPALNEEALLPACLKSIRQQDAGEPFEVIVVDNGSIDRTAEIARAWGARVVPCPERGVAHARQAGLEAARGDVIVQMDADAVLPPGALARVASWFNDRSEERRVGKECRRLCRSRWSPYH
jgi:glycosyltransferase involved in cell wall biosynthesis